MATATLPLDPARSRLPRARGASLRASRAGAVVLSVAGSALAIVIAGLGLLAVPVAALIAFGPAILELL